MWCGWHFDKKLQLDLVSARVGEKVYLEALEKRGCLLMEVTGRPMKGDVFVKPEGFDSEKDLSYWKGKCIAFNPLAKASKKKKKK